MTTSGIYRLTFAPGVEYIGKAIDIEKRWEEHANSFLRNKAATKMMAAFKQYGYPNGEILATVHKDHIDFMESYYIDREKPSLNTVRSESISDEDFELVQELISLLGYSTIDHLKTMKLLQQTKDELRDELESALEQVARLQIEYDEKRETNEALLSLKQQEIRHDREMLRKDEEIEAIRKELALKNRPWYTKLLG